jgi:putative ABC transport system ATP-binding protein
MSSTHKKPQLEARDIAKTFGLTNALRGASAGIYAGEIVAIMGPSGSGKSTLLHCLAGIITPDKGEVLYDGKRLDVMSEEQRSLLRRTAFGFVFQFGQLLPELSAVDNVALPLLLNSVAHDKAYATAMEWLQKLELRGKEQSTPGQLSGGQAQRVAIARAMAIGPGILFADEPTGSLDTHTSEQVMELFTATAKANGTTLVIITHDPRVAAYADREIIVRDGQISQIDAKAAVV